MIHAPIRALPHGSICAALDKAAMEPNQIAPAIVALKERSAALRRYL
jgi:hypothetical protein